MELRLSIRTEAIKDDRPEYSSLQAILYCLLAGHTSKYWRITTQAKDGMWISSVPETHNSHLVTLSQLSGNVSYVLSNSNKTIKMEASPKPGTQEAVEATFRLATADSKRKISGPEELIGSQVMIKPFGFPGMLVMQGTDSFLAAQVPSSSTDQEASRFRLVVGADGKPGSASLSLESKKCCSVLSMSQYYPM